MPWVKAFEVAVLFGTQTSLNFVFISFRTPDRCWSSVTGARSRDRAAFLL
jgi:hypothetical protein